MAKFSFFGRDASRRIAEADSVAVLGLGRFGSALATELMAGGTEVLGVDIDESLVQAHNGELTQVVRADTTREEALRQLAIDEFDRVVVAIGGDVSASILTCSVLLSMDIPVIWAKAVDERHGLILEQLGVHHVIYPEHDMGRRVAHLVRGAALDYIEIAPGYALVKTAVPAMLHGRPLGETGVRSTHGVTIAAYQHGDEDWRNADNTTVLQDGDTILVAGPTATAEAFAQLR
ncbi:TrkA family potassium uptake protein [Microbacterium istanbulense]|uniref:TrkA family potassium uptake protein n=1 Tax=Microbacterium istanbulense TaxID=3122049 RepID=A0ABU8LP47_9MICO